MSKKRNTYTTKESTSQKIIPDWNLIREIIDKIDDPEIRITLQICYLFGTRLQELVRGQTRQEPIIGNDFSEASISGEDALVLEIPTARRGWKSRAVAIPLSSRYEPWAKDILHYSEEKADEPIYPKVTRVLQVYVKNTFSYLEWPTPGYKKKKEKRINRVDVTLKHLPEIREWELGLCHNFTNYDFKNFFGKEYDPDYSVYFQKLLRKSDYYNREDVIKAIEMKNIIFNPSSNEKYYYKEYMDIVKNIKRKFISQEKPMEMKIDPKLLLMHSYSGSESKEHRVLKSNAKKCLESYSNNISFEEANLDVVDLKNGIIIECGHTSARKLLDCFNEVYEDIIKINEFWILQFYDSDYISSCFKFIKSKSYR